MSLSKMNFWSGKKYSDLESEPNKLHQEMQVAIQEKDEAIKNLQTINEDLSSCVSSFENLAYKGRHFPSSKEINNIKSLFVKGTVTPMVCHIIWTLVKKSHNQPGELHSVTVDTKTSEASSGHGKRQSGGFEALSLEEKSNVEKVLSLLDKFCAEDSFYH